MSKHTRTRETRGSITGPAPDATARQPRNRRLPAQERQDQILDAALLVFSERGFGAARMDDIAERAGMSKGGLYAHFRSKEAVFEAVLQRMLMPDLLFSEQVAGSAEADVALQDSSSLASAIDEFLERAYGRLKDERFVRTLHLLIAEGPRAPHALKPWNLRHAELLRKQQAAVTQAVSSGQLRDSALTDMVQLIHAPVLLAAILRFLQDAESVQVTLAKLRAAHRRLLLESLAPKAAADS